MRRAFSLDVAALAVAAAAFVVSFLGWQSANNPADVKLVMAHVVHLSSGERTRASIYLQPVFISTAKNDRAEVIDEVSASLSLADKFAGQDLDWYETGDFDVGPYPSYTINWQIIDRNPEPLAITAGTPQSSVLRFLTRSEFQWAVGTYRVELRAHRVVSRDPLVGVLQFELSEADVQEIMAEGPGRFNSFKARSGE